MKFVEDRPLANIEPAMRMLLELANGMDADRAGRLNVGVLNIQFKEAGGEAIEVASGSHSRDDSFRFAAIATKYELLSSCGSDYHGPESNWTDLGRLAPLPEQCIPVWRDWKLPTAECGSLLPL